MFTGIIVDTGRLQRRIDAGGDATLEIAADKLTADVLSPGASVAVNGVCLTVTESEGNVFGCDVSCETLRLTTLSRLASGDVVNLEPALRAGDELGGHLVTGHVDGIGTITGRRQDGRSIRLHVRAPEELVPYIAGKGSIAIDGISLTVNDIRGVQFGVNIVPYTLEATTAGAYGNGSQVNLEVDLVARYVGRWLGTHAGTKAEE